MVNRFGTAKRMTDLADIIASCWLSRRCKAREGQVGDRAVGTAGHGPVVDVWPTLAHGGDRGLRSDGEGYGARRIRRQPEVPTRHRKRMRSNPVAPWELRVGDYRVFYDLEPADDETLEPDVVVLAVGLKTGNRVSIGGEEYQL